MKISCLVFCVYFILVQPALCRPAEEGTFQKFGNWLYSGVEKVKNFFGFQPEVKSSTPTPIAIDTDSPTRNPIDLDPTENIIPVNTQPSQQKADYQSEENKGVYGNEEAKPFPTSPLVSTKQASALDSARSGETCVTLNNEIGTCVLYLECNWFLNHMYNQKSNEKIEKLLKKAKCNNDADKTIKVCCPSAEPEIKESEFTTTLPDNGATRRQITIYKDFFVPALPEPPVCGFTNVSLNKVVNGVDANLGDFPWMALLGYKRYDADPIRWNCGGSLITSRHVLTASHCVFRYEDSLSVVRLGELDISRDDDGANPIDVPIKHMLKHEDYDRTTNANDIAVLVLARNIKFTELIAPICLPTSAKLRNNNFEDYTPFIAGWGKTAWEGKKANHLQVAQLTVMPNEECKKYWKFITESALCIGYDEEGQDSCEGDSGGPLMQPLTNPKDQKTYFYETGIVSFGLTCADSKPAVYTRVTHHMPWILSKVVGNTNSLN